MAETIVKKFTYRGQEFGASLVADQQGGRLLSLFPPDHGDAISYVVPPSLRSEVGCAYRRPGAERLLRVCDAVRILEQGHV